MNETASLQDISDQMAGLHPKQRALGLIIQGVKLAQSRGAFSLGEAVCLADAIRLFAPSPQAKDSKEDSKEDSTRENTDPNASSESQSCCGCDNEAEDETENGASAEAPKGAAAPADDEPKGNPVGEGEDDCGKPA